jgi:HAD superfamily hydrolase (TIGR01509 family)
MIISAVIFDLDGTVLDNEDEYGKAFNKVLKDLGVDSGTDYPAVGSIGVHENWPILIEKYKIKTDKTIEELGHTTQEAYLKQINQVTLKLGINDFIKNLKESGVPIALATSNDWFIVEADFDRLKLDHYFDCVVTGEEVRDKKPAPDLFLKAAEKLSVEPKECLVIEDAPAGVKAAHTAGMKVVAIARNDETEDELTEADLVVRSYGEITPEELAKL